MSFATVIVGNPREKTDQERVSESEWARALISSKNFAQLVTDTADRITFEWSVVKEPERQLAARNKLDGLRALVAELQIMVDQGLQPKPKGESAQQTNP